VNTIPRRELMRFLAFLMFAVFASAEITGPDTKDKFVGTWTLQKVEALDDAGHWTPMTDYWAGINPVGYLIYDSAGNMAVQIMRRDRLDFPTSDENDDLSIDEFKAYCGKQPLTRCLGYGGYFGTFKVDETEGAVTHHLIGASVPNTVGTDAKRFYRFEGDTLTLMPSRDRRLIWKRLR
jgi:hypothetical protein